MDEPGDRRSHQVSTPSLGGIGIFAGVVFSVIMWTPFQVFGDLQFILCAFIILFLIGAKDDIDPVSPTKKIGGQIFAAAILVFKAHIKITSLYGIFGIFALPEVVSIVLSIFTIVVIINAFNLIDGINGLAASTGILMSFIFGTWYYLVSKPELAVLAFSLAGATLAFLRFNLTPAKIFMGDTGSLLLGLVASILALSFIDNQALAAGTPLYFPAAPSFAIAVLILPLFDTARVIAVRLILRRSPFQPDRNHIHHLMIDSGYSHMQATFILIFVNLIFIAVAYFMQPFGNLVSIFVITVIGLLGSHFLHKRVLRKSARLILL